MNNRFLDGTSPYAILRAPDGVDSGVPTDGGEISMDEGMSLFGSGDEDNDAATADEGDGAGEESEPVEGEDDGPLEDDEAPVEPEEDDPAEKLPPVEPPRSWSKEDKAEFAKLPHATQERLAERERSREADFLRRQQEATKVTRSLTEREQAANQARQQYEQIAQQYAEATKKHLENTFSDITSWDDVKKMAGDDPVRYGEWQAARAEAEAAAAESTRIEAQQHREAAERFGSYISEERKRFLEVAPEYADPKQAPRLQAEVRDMLVNDYHLSPEELKALWVDGAPLSVHDHRFQMLIRDANRFRAAQKSAAKKPAPKTPETPVQRPGQATSRREAIGSRTKQLDTTLTQTGSRDAGLALIMSRIK